MLELYFWTYYKFWASEIELWLSNYSGVFPFTSLYGATLWSLRMRAFSVSQPQPAGKPQWLEELCHVGGGSCWLRGTWNHHSRFASHVASVWRASAQKVLSRLLRSAVVADAQYTPAGSPGEGDWGVSLCQASQDKWEYWNVRIYLFEQTIALPEDFSCLVIHR